MRESRGCQGPGFLIALIHRSPLWEELLLYERLCCLSCGYRVCVPMHYLPLTVFGSKDHRGPKDPRVISSLPPILASPRSISTT